MGQVVPDMTLISSGSVDNRIEETRIVQLDLDAKRRVEVLQHVASRSGAVVMSRRAFEQSTCDPSGYAFQMPIFVLTRRPPVEAVNGRSDQLRVSFVSDDIEAAVASARSAAGSKDVAVIGDAKTAQQLIRAGLVDELNLDVVPVLIGQGLRFFQYEAGSDHPLETPSEHGSEERFDRHFRVIKPTVRLQPTRFPTWI